MKECIFPPSLIPLAARAITRIKTQKGRDRMIEHGLIVDLGRVDPREVQVHKFTIVLTFQSI